MTKVQQKTAARTRKTTTPAEPPPQIDAAAEMRHGAERLFVVAKTVKVIASAVILRSTAADVDEIMSIAGVCRELAEQANEAGMRLKAAANGTVTP